MEKPSVLIIDDHQLIRDMWTRVLETSGKVTVLKIQGRLTQALALELIASKKPDIILLDVYMAPLTGFELMPIIKQSSPNSRVIGFSVHANAAYAKQLLELGAYGYVTKSAEINEVLEAIDEVQKGNIFLNNEIKEMIGNVEAVKVR
jgi:Response regulator containing a CheY-like receiver domain and an HTH DNA-binding domain